jgi:hypothetical protein
MLLSGGMGLPVYHIVCGGAPREAAGMHREDRHLAAVEGTKQIAAALGLSPDARVDTLLNRIRIGQNVLCYCRFDEFAAWWAGQRQKNSDLSRRSLNAYVEKLENTGATRHVTPFVRTIGELAQEKQFAQREGRPVSGQAGMGSGTATQHRVG